MSAWFRRCFAIFILILSGAAAAPAARAETTYSFNLPEQSLADSLRAIGQQTEMNILFEPDAVKNTRSPALRGQYTVDEAIRLVLAGTKLEAQHTAASNVVIKVKSARSTVLPPTSVEGATRLAQASTATSQSSPEAQSASNVPEGNSKQEEKKKALTEIVVTGSRIPQAPAQAVQEYDRQQIDKSGQTTIADFLNTLPMVSTSIAENGTQTFGGATTVRLRGLPAGTTLVLIDGRRLEGSGTQPTQPIFDLSNIPLSAVERVEVVADGSSAIYGSDAIAGVVNIILKKNLDGLELNANYDHASGIAEDNASIAWGRQWDRGSLSIVGSYQNRDALLGSERALTANGDYRQYGGRDTRFSTCNPGNVFSTNGHNLPGLNAPYAAVPTGNTAQPTLAAFAGTAGTLNECTLGAYDSVIPQTERAGLLARGDFRLESGTELFAELLFSQIHQFQDNLPPILFGQPGFAQYTVSAANPYNSFGQTVGIGYIFSGLGRNGTSLDTTFAMPVVGARGRFLDTWSWEVSAWEARDKSNTTLIFNLNSSAAQAALNSSNPATALNPFVPGAAGPPQLLQSLVYSQETDYSSNLQTINAFVRGQLYRLPSGAIDVVLGGEFDRNTLSSEVIGNAVSPASSKTWARNNHAIFGEARIPLLANAANPGAGDRLVATIAGRNDTYGDFGNKTTPQYGVEWRPFDSLLLRATYAEAFKAPSLYAINKPTTTPFPVIVTDPLRNNQTTSVMAIQGGNPGLRPETGRSNALGFVYSSEEIENLQLSATGWSIDENGSIQSLSSQVIINNESVFSGNVIRAPTCAGGPPCPITTVLSTFLNFGNIQVRGLDYQATYNFKTPMGQFFPSLAATETTTYRVALLPNQPAIDRVSVANADGNFAPRWKGTAALGWKLRSLSANLDGRYVGEYQDYGSTRMIGNFWLCDLNLKYDFGEVGLPLGAKGAYVSLGAVNIFNRLPQFSNFDNGAFGYDPTQGDIRGRFISATASFRF